MDTKVMEEENAPIQPPTENTTVSGNNSSRLRILGITIGIVSIFTLGIFVGVQYLQQKSKAPDTNQPTLKATTPTQTSKPSPKTTVQGPAETALPSTAITPPETKKCAKEGEIFSADEKNMIDCDCVKPFQHYEQLYGPFFDSKGNEFYKDEPECVVVDRYFICINCGDGNCGIGENECNCPQDCDLTACVGEGGTLFPNDGNKCCAGLRAEWNYEIQGGGDCKPIQGALGHQLVCVKCRDGICGNGETGCNCPQDCKDFKCKAHGEIPRYTAPEDDMSIQCCEGLKHRTQKEYFDKNCEDRPIAGYAGICLACGDGKCDSQYESKCNCPEDCK